MSTNLNCWTESIEIVISEYERFSSDPSETKAITTIKSEFFLISKYSEHIISKYNNKISK